MMKVVGVASISLPKYCDGIVKCDRVEGLGTRVPNQNSQNGI
jgi:hypothetical protein